MGLIGLDLSNPLQRDIAPLDPLRKKDARILHALSIHGSIQVYQKRKIKSQGF